MRPLTLTLLFGLVLIAVASAAQDAAYQAQSLMEQGVKLLKEGQADAAEPILRRAVLLAPDDALAYFYLGGAQMAGKEYAEASSSFRTALRLDGQKPTLGRQNRREAQDDLGLSLAFQKDYAAARQAYREAIAQDPDYPSLPYNLACVCALAGDRKASLEALASAEQADARSPAGPSLPDPSADTDLKGLWGDPVFQAILIMNVGPQPGDGPGSALMREGARLLATGDAAGAAAKERSATDAEAGSQQAWFFLGGALGELGKRKEAAEAFGRCLALARPPDVRLTVPMLRFAHLRVGEEFLAEGSDADAAAAFQSAVEADPYRPQAYYGLAEARAGLGDQKGAGEALKKAFALREEAPALDLPLPDPSKCPAFAKWAADTAWQALLKGL